MELIGVETISDWRDMFVFGRRGPGYIDQFIVDFYSLFHFFSGFLLGVWFEDDWLIVLSILVFWEIVENSSRGTRFWREWVSLLLPGEDQTNYYGDSWGNLISDIIIGMIGYWVAITWVV